ncbi:hypothetical protein ACFE04_018267 [Oxalis oulophora]
MAAFSLSLTSTTQNHHHFKPSSSNLQKLTPTHFSNPSKTQESSQLLYKSYFHQISSLSKDAQIKKAITLLTEMDLEGIPIGPEIYGELLQGCVYDRALSTGQQIHARILKNGDFFSKNEYIETKLLIFYAKCDLLVVASSLFSKLRVYNVFSWAAIIGLNSRLGANENALMGFVRMLEDGFLPDNFVVPNALKACGALNWIGFGKGVHGYVMKEGYDECVFIGSSLVDMYGKCGFLNEARGVFDKMMERNVVAWNSMIVGYVQNRMNEEAIDLFYDMRMEGFEISQVTVLSFLSASANLGALEVGKQGHALAIVSGLELNNVLGSSLLNFYSKVGLIDDAELVFCKIREKDVVTWNLLVSCYVTHGLVEKALNTSRWMRSEKMRFDSVTLSSIFSVSSYTTDIKLGKVAHCYCIRHNFESDVVIASSIMDMYAKCERIDCARRAFESTTNKDLILWNTLLASYAELGWSGEALRIFYKMQLEGITANLITWNSVLLAFLRNGQVTEAEDMFFQMQSVGVQPNIITWTTLISGLIQNGFGYEAISKFQEMQECGINPNAKTLTSILSACSNISSLHHGKEIHGYILRHGCLSLSIPISTALIDMYAKCGNIVEANRVFKLTSNKELPIYNAMISGFALHGRTFEALSLYGQLKEEGMTPDDITFTNILSACTHAGLVNEGLEFFVDIVSKNQIKPSMEHYGCVVNLLSRCGNINEAVSVILSMPCEPDAPILGSLLAACIEHSKIELVDYLSKYLRKLEPDNSGNYVALSNAYASTGKWDKVSKVRESMKESGIRKSPGCSWIQIGGEVHVFVAGDGSHPKTEEIYALLALLGTGGVLVSN